MKIKLDDLLGYFGLMAVILIFCLLMFIASQCSKVVITEHISDKYRVIQKTEHEIEIKWGKYGLSRKLLVIFDPVYAESKLYRNYSIYYSVERKNGVISRYQGSGGWQHFDFWKGGRERRERNECKANDE